MRLTLAVGGPPRLQLGVQCAQSGFVHRPQLGLGGPPAGGQLGRAAALGRDGRLHVREIAGLQGGNQGLVGHGGGGRLVDHGSQLGYGIIKRLHLGILGLALVQLPPGGAQLRLCVVQLPPGIPQLPPGVVQFPLAVPELPLSIGNLLLRVGDLPFGVRQLPLSVGDLLFGVGQLPPAVGVLRRAVGILPLAVLQLPEGVGQLLLGIGDLLLAVGAVQEALGVVLFALLIVRQAVGVLRRAVRQLPVGVGQLVADIRQLPVVVRPAVGQLPLTVPELLHGVAVQRLIAQRRPLPGAVLHGRLQGVDLVAVRLGVGRGGIVQSEENLIVCLKVKPVLRYVHEARHAAVTDGGGAPLVVEIVGGGHQPHQGIALVGKELPGVLIVGPGQGDGLPDVLLREEAVIPHALAGGLGHPA